MGSKAHDEIFWSEERGYYRETNRAGGLEGGMTTGDPVVVHGAMKPLPTLTKPLRSVDIETKEPAQALRERTDSCTVPAAGVVGEAMVALVLASAYREKFGGDHIDDVRAALAAYRSGSGGGAGSGRPGAAGTRRRAGARVRRLHGRRQVDRGARGRGRAGRRAARLRPRARARLGESIESFFDREGEDAFRAREEEVVLELLAERPRRAWWRSAAGSVQSERVRDALRDHTVVQLEVDPEDAWRRASGRAARWRATRAGSSSCTRDREPLYESVADAVLPPGGRDAIRAALPALLALARGTRRARGSSGRGPTRASTRSSSAAG